MMSSKFISVLMEVPENEKKNYLSKMISIKHLVTLPRQVKYESEFLICFRIQWKPLNVITWVSRETIYIN
jgi:hypothetical protein